MSTMLSTLNHLRKRCRRIPAVLLLGAFVLILPSCSGAKNTSGTESPGQAPAESALTREDALALLKTEIAKLPATRPTIVEWGAGRTSYDTIGFRQWYWSPVYFWLESAGYIQITGPPTSTVTIVLTDKGKAESKSWRRIGDGWGLGQWAMPTAVREVTEVSKINTTSAGISEVEFNWKWVTNPIGQSLLSQEFMTDPKSPFRPSYFFDERINKATADLRAEGKTWNVTVKKL